MNSINTRRLTKPRRHPGQWTSYNKVLIGCGKRPHARNPNFDFEETTLLIRLWGDPTVQRTLITTHKKYPVIAKIAMSMRDHGYNRTPEEINTRIKNLKCFYNRVKKDLEMEVINTPSWPHYEAMDEILSRPIFGNNARLNVNPSQSSQSSQSPKDSVAHLVEPEIKEESFTDEDSPRLQIVEAKDLMLVPKDEPFDEEDQAELLDSEIDEDFDEDLDEDQPPLPKLQKCSNPFSPPPLPQLDKIVPRPVELKLVDAPPTSATATISSTPSTPLANGKISLVPTNILLKPQAQAQYKSATPNLISTPPTAGSAAVPTSQGMKVVFVTGSANGGASATQQPNSSQSPVTLTPVPPKMQAKPMPHLTSNKGEVSSSGQATPTLTGSKDQATFRGLMKQLIRLQNENLTMQRQRLNIERQRLEVERNLGNRIIDLLSTLQHSVAASQVIAAPCPTRSSYRLRREKRTNHRSTDEEDKD